MSAPNRPSTDSLDVGRVDDEKHRAEADHTEGQLGGITQEDVDFVNNFPEDRKKRVLSKIDVCSAANPLGRTLLTSFSGG